jgi:predicted enzyme related to lactoylglutathione lyase
MLQNARMYTYIPAKDVARARAFYEVIVGLEPKQELNGGVIYEFAGGTACFLYPTPNAGTSQATQAFWDVKDIESEVADLKSRGVRFERYTVPEMNMDMNDIATAGGARTAWFKDTEGNIMAIVESLSKTR